MELLTSIVLVMRPSVDSLFNAMRFEVAGMEMTAGMFLNLAVLGLAALMILNRSGSAFAFIVSSSIFLVCFSASEKIFARSVFD